MSSQSHDGAPAAPAPAATQEVSSISLDMDLPPPSDQAEEEGVRGGGDDASLAAAAADHNTNGMISPSSSSPQLIKSSSSDIKIKVKKFLRHYFWQPHNKSNRIIRQKTLLKEAQQDMPIYQQKFLKYRNFIALLLPALIVHAVWWPVMLLPHNKLDIVQEYSFATVTMVFGSIVAGMTSEGGAAIAFPVFTLAFSVPPTVARDFSFMIQSVGMTAASFSIFIMGVHIDWSALVYATLGGIVGIILGLEYIAPAMDPVTKKLAFVSVWFAFAFSLFLLNRNHDRPTFRNVPTYKCNNNNNNEDKDCETRTTTTTSTTTAGVTAIATNVKKFLHTRVPSPEPSGLQLWPAIVLFLTGIFGGMNSAISGSGLDICSFAILTLLFRVNERTATPTSVVLMAGNTLVGFLYRQFGSSPEGPIASLAWNLFAASAFVVPFGAPLGTVLGARLHRITIACLLYALDTIQLISAWVLLEPKMTAASWGMSVGIILIGSLLFALVTSAGTRLQRFSAMDVL